MVLKHTPEADLGAVAPDFALAGADGREWRRDDVRGERGLLVMFISNHCPYVKAIRERLVEDVRVLLGHGIGAVAIQPNDVERYPEDGLERMAEVAREFDFPFPYVLDESQQTARVYGAVCTPDFFGYDADLKLRYRGRIDAAGSQPPSGDERRELLEAMLAVARTGQAPAEQHPSMGCSIKWRDA